jgi:hypothetical protein
MHEAQTRGENKETAWGKKGEIVFTILEEVGPLVVVHTCPKSTLNILTAHSIKCKRK